MHFAHAEASGRLFHKVRAAPPHNPVLVELGSAHHDFTKRLGLARCQQSRPAWRRECRQPIHATLIVSLNPVVQRLAVHARELRRLRPRPSVHHERNRMHSAGLSCVLYVRRDTPQFLRRVLFARYLHWRPHHPAPWSEFNLTESNRRRTVNGASPAEESLFKRVGIRPLPRFALGRPTDGGISWRRLATSPKPSAPKCPRANPRARIPPPAPPSAASVVVTHHHPGTAQA